MKSILITLAALLLWARLDCEADPIWATGNSLLEVISYDLKAHDSNQKLDDYQTNAVCMLLGYFAGFAESSSVSFHYDASALPFILPDGISNDDIERAVYQFLTDNPDKLDMKGDALVTAALAKVYPNPAFKLAAPHVVLMASPAASP
jgi:hypothetical protein